MSQTLNIIKSKLEEHPNNIEAEQSVIGSILVANEIFDEVSLIITNKNFDIIFLSITFFLLVKDIKNFIKKNIATFKTLLS